MTALPLVEQFQYGLDAPICLTWELTYACNLSCVHCLSSSGRRDPRELSTAECKAVIDELERMQVFYVNIGGGEPTVRPDFWELVDYATEHHVGVKFSTNGVKITAEVAQRLAASDYVDVQISLDGATAAVNDVVRGKGSYDTALRAMRNLYEAGFKGFKISVVMTRENVGQLDDFKAIADRYDAQLRITRLRPSGRGADVWDELHVTAAQQRELYDWLVANGENVLTGDSFFHLAAFGDALPGLNLCGAGRVVCLIDPVGDVYACPFAIHENFLAGNVRDEGGFQRVWRESELFTDLRSPQTGGACNSCSAFDACRGGCMAAKFFTGLPLDGPDPECVKGHGERALLQIVAGSAPKPSLDHSHRTVPVTISRSRPDRACDENPWLEWMSELAELSWPDVAVRAAAGAILAVPLGSTEQHGPHLPLSTDTDVAVALCARLAAARVDVLVAPPVPYGSSGEHAGFAGTLSIGQEATELLVVELVRSAATTFERVVLVSAHGGNVGPVGRAVERLHAESRDVLLHCPRWDGDPHAGRTETSLQLALQPALVGAEREPGDTRPMSELLPLLLAGGVRAVAANGILGDPTGASAAEGTELLDTLAARLIAEVAAWAD